MSTPTDRTKVIIDCDPGIDDAQAIMIALADKNIEVVALTIAYGNSSVKHTARNALRLVKFCNCADIPVFTGCTAPLNFADFKSDYFHGHDGFGDIELPGVDPVDVNCIQKEHASVALCRLVAAQPGDITLVAIGPLTNIAVAIMLDNHFGDKLKDCVVMGGNYLARGNITISAEFNWYADPEAAYGVLTALNRLITLAPLEVCYETPFSWEWYRSVKELPNKAADFLKRLDQHTVSPKPGGQKPHFIAFDQLAVAVVANPKVVLEAKEVFVTVELHGSQTRGQVAVDWNETLGKPPNVRLVTKVDQALCQQILSMAFTVV